MTSFIQSSASNPEGIRAKSLADASLASQAFDDTRGLATLLLAAVVAAMVVVADQMISNWADGDLLLGWVILWAVGFVALVFLTGTAQRSAARLIQALDRWAQATARRRAEERMWELAQRDPRVMAEIRHVQAGANVDSKVDGKVDASNADVCGDQLERESVRRGRYLAQRYY